MASVIDKSGARRADLAAIHVIKKALAWDDDTYRDIMFTVCRTRSAGELDFAGRKRFLAHLMACQEQKGIAGRQKAVKTPWTRQQRLLWSLWQQLADAGLVESRDRKALDAWVHRQCGVDRLEWLTDAQIDLAITSAKGWIKRKKEA